MGPSNESDTISLEARAISLPRDLGILSIVSLSIRTAEKSDYCLINVDVVLVH